MGDEQVIRFLEEIRDLQKLHVENYKDALKNQQESIAINKAAFRRSRIIQLIFAIFLLGILALLWLPHFR